jgi:effector-binding domain-containing protein
MSDRAASPDVSVQTVQARKLAAVRRRVKIGSVGAAWKPALDQVWAFLRTHAGLRTDGHNVFLYHHPASRDQPMDVDFGVEVVRAFEPEGEVVSTETPAGEIAVAVHVGPYAQLHRAHDAIHAWRARTGRAFAGASWEVYGDWSDDPGKLETTICYLLA